MGNWSVAYTLPSLFLQQPFENQYLALVPYNDERIRYICETVPSAKKLINCFIDSRKRPIKPTVLLINDNAPNNIRTTEALISFRNIIATSVMLRGWADTRSEGPPWSPLFSNAFDFYPMTLGKDGGLLYETPALSSYYYETVPFIAMPSDVIPQNKICVFDKSILDLLLKIWLQRFINGVDNNYNERIILRSIEMAYHALSVPVKNLTTIFDIGVNICLWVSAFEILAHPKTECVKQTDVLNLVDGYRWYHTDLEAKIYEIKVQKRGKTNVNLAQKLYKELYDARNNFLHGNEVSYDDFCSFGNKSAWQLLKFAPIVYRTALFVMLDRLLIYERTTSSYFSEFPYEESLLQIMPAKVEK